MSNIEKIKAEIERRKNICEGIFERESDTYYQGKAIAYGELLPFIESLPEEKPSEDLEEENRKTRDAEVILNGHGLLIDVTKWADGYKLKAIIKEN